MNNPAQVYVNTNFTPSSPSPNGVNKKFLLVGVIALILIAESVWAYNQLMNNPGSAPSGSASTSEEVKEEKFASMLLTGSDMAKVGQDVKVLVNVNTGYPINAVDAIITYDPAMLTLVPVSSASAIAVGNVLPDYPVNSNDSETGTIAVSAVAPPNGKDFVGTGLLGTLTFKPKVAGQSEIKLQYQSGSSTDSNLIDAASGSDILKEVSNLKITITP